MIKDMALFFYLVYAAFIFLFSYFVTEYIRQYSLRNNVVDVPNERSSHLVPTPTGGGVSICLSIIFTALMFMGEIHESQSLALAIALGVVLIGIVGWIDIHKEVSVMNRAFLYLMASAWVVFTLDGPESLMIAGFSLEPGWLSRILAILGLTWLINLYNFMDGTDGLAGIQAVSTGVSGGVFFCLSNDYSATVICMVLAISSAGFLVQNWMPAKIFMGDVGSCSIGFTFGVMAVHGEISGLVPAYIWLILLNLFITDSSLTLVKRFVKGEQWYRAHNTHAYQRLVQMGMTHASLAKLLAGLNMLVIFPAALTAWMYNEYALWVLGLLYLLSSTAWVLVNRKFADKTLAGQ